MEHGPRLRTANSNEGLENCLDCYQSIIPKDKVKIMSGSKVVGYRHSKCSIPAHVRQKYPNAR